MKKTAAKHNMTCLLHEKPFQGVNGSGKHNNWSIGTNTGVNLLEPGDSPMENAQFLLFFCAVIKAVDEYPELLRISVASAGNDHRLGGYEAPPAIVSIFIGDELQEILEAIENNAEYFKRDTEVLKIGVHTLPKFPRDTTDRNRTSPFAFTGNKFEFRMVGSNFSIAGPNIMLNTIVAEELSSFADILENAEDFNAELHSLIQQTIRNHKRIIFNGNNYSDDWIKEAKKRGLINCSTTVDALAHYLDEKNVQLFTKHKIFTEQELHSRYEILLENYCKTINIEALTMIEMTKRDIIPAGISFTKDLCTAISAKKGVSDLIPCSAEESLLQKAAALTNDIYKYVEELSRLAENAGHISDYFERGCYYKDIVLPVMVALRGSVDSLEIIVGRKYWPYPSYAEILYSIK